MNFMGTEVTAESLKTLNIGQIAEVIHKDHTLTGKSINFAAVPYVAAMRSLETPDDKFFADDGRSVILYAMSNLSTWRGEIAKLVKAELKRRLKAK